MEREAGARHSSWEPEKSGPFFGHRYHTESTQMSSRPAAGAAIASVTPNLCDICVESVAHGLRSGALGRAFGFEKLPSSLTSVSCTPGGCYACWLCALLLGSTASVFPMVFTKRLREGVLNGSITCSVRIWKRLHVRVGGRYQMGEGAIEVDSIEQIAIQDITHALAIESGFLGVIDLLKVAKHGPGDTVYLIRFHYIRPPAGRPEPD